MGDHQYIIVLIPYRIYIKQQLHSIQPTDV